MTMLTAQRQSAGSFNVARALDEALKCHRAGRTAEAERLYVAILAARPGHFDALHMMALIRRSQGRLAEALMLIAAAMKARPNAPDVHLNHGLILHAMQRPQEALAAFDEALNAKPRYAEAYNNSGSVLASLGRPDEALERYERALKLKPDYAEAHYNKGNLLLAQGQPQKALQCFDRATALRPNYAKAHTNRGQALEALGRKDEALACFEKALAIDPRLPEALANAGNMLVKLRRYPQAVPILRQALAINPHNADGHYNLANALQWSGECDEAVAEYDRALDLEPGRYDPLWNKALLTLALGDLGEGWRQYEVRSLSPTARPRGHTAPRWDGEPLPGTLLVSAEQGLGDQILYFGMVEEARSRVGHLVLEVEPRLVPLFRRALPDVEVVAAAVQLYGGAVDAQLPFGSLGQYLRPSFDAFPRRSDGYLKPDAARAAVLKSRLSPDGAPLVGLSWHSAGSIAGEAKSARLMDFAALLQKPGVRFVDLQYGDTSTERAAASKELGVAIEHVDDIDNTNDIDALAALASACDAVVTVSNTTAHLAGALGVPTHVLVPFGQAQLWCWFKHGESSPWYPRVRLYRQAIGQPWTELMPNVVAGMTSGSV